MEQSARITTAWHHHLWSSIIGDMKSGVRLKISEKEKKMGRGPTTTHGVTSCDRVLPGVTRWRRRRKGSLFMPTCFSRTFVVDLFFVVSISIVLCWCRGLASGAALAQSEDSRRVQEPNGFLEFTTRHSAYKAHIQSGPSRHGTLLTSS